jgi:hypothetical protein
MNDKKIISTDYIEKCSNKICINDNINKCINNKLFGSSYKLNHLNHLNHLDFLNEENKEINQNIEKFDKNNIIIDDIDIVITFVDSKNEEWKKMYNKHKFESFDPKRNNMDSSAKQRFRSSNELLYCLRSIDQYIDFYRYIFLVLNHSPPKWLNLNNPKLKIIYHDQIESFKPFLPTFNSQAIECHLHNIPGLANHYLYFNDDIFVAKKLSRDIFINNPDKTSSTITLERIPIPSNDRTEIPSIDRYTIPFLKRIKQMETDKDNASRLYNVYVDRQLSKYGNPTVDECGFRSAWKNSNKILDKLYKPELRRKIAHSPSIINKEVMIYLSKLLEKEFYITSSSKFRAFDNINPTCSILQYFYYYEGIGKLIESSNIKTFYLKDINKDVDKINEILEHRDLTFFCVEDDVSETNDGIDRIDKILSVRFKKKSQFEL